MKTRSPHKSVCMWALALTAMPFLVTQVHSQVQVAEKPAAQDIQPEQDEDEIPAGQIFDEYPLADLPPLRRLVLYNSGVGQLQHEGKVVGKQRFEIKFGAHDVDDVIKSLVFADEGGGMVRAVEYQPAPEPEDVAANTVGMPMTLAQLIQRFRGEAVTLTIGGRQHQGTVYGVENRTAGEQVTEVIVLLTSDGLHSVDLSHVDRVQFDKEELRQTLNQAMQGIVKSRKADQKKLEFLFDGEGERDIRFAYVVDMPIWRMTYRLSIKQDKVYLQGWAHVDNITGVDWEQVALELRSGKPQSFHINIFAPLMAERPDFGNAVFEFTRGLYLVTQWFGFEPAARFNEGPASGGGGFGGVMGGGGFGGGGGGSRPRRGASPGVDIESAFRQAAQESRTAQMVRYVLEKPVDLGAGRSAALPVFSNEIPANLISVYDENDDGTTPFRAVQITNATDLSIVSGPVSIMRDGDFVGDGKLGRLDVDQKTEVVYGVDRAVQIVVEKKGMKPRLVKVSLDEKDGIVLHRQLVRKTFFRIHNRDTDARELVLYCASPGDDNETMAPEPESSTGGRARFAVQVDARSQMEFEVAYQSEREETRALNGANAKLLELDDQDDVEVPEEVTVLLNHLIAIDESISNARLQHDRLRKEKSVLEAEQMRVRDNLKVLADNPEAAKPFLDKLQAIEEQIEEVNRKSNENQAEITKIEAEQTSFIEAFFDK